MIKEEAKDKIKSLELELQHERARKLQQEYDHQQRINEFETDKARLINEHQQNKDNLNYNINELANRLSEQQKNAINGELQRNADKKDKEDELTNKIHYFSNVESDLAKQIDCNYADIDYLQSMNRYLEENRMELLDTYNTQRVNYENDTTNTRNNNNDIIREKENTIANLSSNVERLHGEVAKNLEEMRTLTLERADLSNYISGYRSYLV